MSTWRRLQHGWPERFPLAQFPNVPLLIALAASLLHVRSVFYLAMGAWAWLELTAGTNWFRRLLGAAAIVYLTARLGTALDP